MCVLIYVSSICILLSIFFRCLSLKNHFFKWCHTLPKALVLLIGWQALLMPRIAPEIWKYFSTEVSYAVSFHSQKLCQTVYARRKHGIPAWPQLKIFSIDSTVQNKFYIHKDCDWLKLWAGGNVQTQVRQIVFLWPVSVASKPQPWPTSWSEVGSWQKMWLNHCEFIPTVSKTWEHMSHRWWTRATLNIK